ncbi:arginine vasopressin-induced protein 1 [Hippocampus zosterae]|uniref:arginine vasopressin-induced protein 1 n=1 Tax=Hippocampus zosterae TaxID=109293 RepID=UPI00223DBCBB|nr:arginine vasopressin-induced protein 1 [Hippocampus zosterae]XP_051936009.1 arginine vasopressin-induced protein 1 [Hippocampus zosterae]
MDSGPTSPPSSVVASPSTLWRLAERRARKAGSGNIFSNVNLWQLQRLFRAAGDQDAEQRAQLVWAHRDETELAQALVGLRTRSHGRVLRASRRDLMGTHWLRAFNHLRIEEGFPSSPEKDSGEETDPEAVPHNSEGPHQHTTTEQTTGPSAVLNESRGFRRSERPPRSFSSSRTGGESDPDRYLHRIQH